MIHEPDPLTGPCLTCLRYFRRSELVETLDGWTHGGCWGRAAVPADTAHPIYAFVSALRMDPHLGEVDPGEAPPTP